MWADYELEKTQIFLELTNMIVEHLIIELVDILNQI